MLHARITAKAAITAMGNFILPPTCLACEKQVVEQGVLCSECWSEMRFIDKPYCAVLGTPFAFDLGEGALGADAIANPPVFDRARAVALYDDVARKLVQGLKFSDRTDLAPWMARWMVRAGSELLEDRPMVIGVPLHRRRMFFRRFNQSAELARQIAAAADLEYAPQALQRIRATKQQVGLGARERHRNVRGAFRVDIEQKAKICGKHLLLVDDVLTTGATLTAASRALLRGGAASVDCLTFARVVPGGI
ncbi:MAG: ComF family protein [Rhodobacteraceae bacterium]|nr:ComF family protein [Paracoccaceae bacterium]